MALVLWNHFGCSHCVDVDAVCTIGQKQPTKEKAKNVKFLFAQVSNFSQEFLLDFCIQWMMYLQERNNEIRWNRV